MGCEPSAIRCPRSSVRFPLPASGSKPSRLKHPLCVFEQLYSCAGGQWVERSISRGAAGRCPFSFRPIPDHRGPRDAGEARDEVAGLQPLRVQRSRRRNGYPTGFGRAESQHFLECLRTETDNAARGSNLYYDMSESSLSWARSAQGPQRDADCGQAVAMRAVLKH